MKGLKPLLPSLKEKKRYLAFEVVNSDKISSFSEVSSAIWFGVLSFIGARGAAEIGIMVLPEKYAEDRQRGIVRVTNKGLEALKASLSLITDIGGKQAIIRSLGASGIIKKADNYLWR